MNVANNNNNNTHSHMNVIKSDQFAHKICGMNSNMIHAFRSSRNDPNKLDETFKSMINRIEKRLRDGLKEFKSSSKTGEEISVGFTFGNVAQVLSTHNLNMLENDVVICFILDTLDIDSKMVTAIRKASDKVESGEKSIVWKLLYKFDATNNGI